MYSVSLVESGFQGFHATCEGQPRWPTAPRLRGLRLAVAMTATAGGPGKRGSRLCGSLKGCPRLARSPALSLASDLWLERFERLLWHHHFGLPMGVRVLSARSVDWLRILFSRVGVKRKAFEAAKNSKNIGPF